MRVFGGFVKACHMVSMLTRSHDLAQCMCRVLQPWLRESFGSQRHSADHLGQGMSSTQSERSNSPVGTPPSHQSVGIPGQEQRSAGDLAARPGRMTQNGEDNPTRSLLAKFKSLKAMKPHVAHEEGGGPQSSGGRAMQKSSSTSTPNRPGGGPQAQSASKDQDITPPPRSAAGGGGLSTSGGHHDVVHPKSRLSSASLLASSLHPTEHTDTSTLEPVASHKSRLAMGSHGEAPTPSSLTSGTRSHDGRLEVEEAQEQEHEPSNTAMAPPYDHVKEAATTVNQLLFNTMVPFNVQALPSNIEVRCGDQRKPSCCTLGTKLEHIACG